jgi:hypothetical protein
MKKINIKAHAIFIVATIIHFILTSIVGHYAAIQIGSSTGQVVAKGLIEATENSMSSEKEVNEIYQDMKSRSDEVISRWKIPLFLISLPIKPFINPLLNKIRKAWIYEPVFSKKISKDQLKTRGKIIENVTNGLNSLAFGLLIYLAFRIRKKCKSE